MEELYMDIKNRDKKVRELKTQGYKIRKTSVRNQSLHPTYVKDYDKEISNSEKGFGNDLYKTYFSVLYSYVIEEDV